jgi:2-dehydropantoate 2-reductase
MKTLIAGAGALGGLLAARLLSNGVPVWLAVRDEASAARLKAAGLRASGAGGDARAAVQDVAALDTYTSADRFALVVLATKAHDALKIAPGLAQCLAPDGVLLPLQNGAVSELLAEKLGGRVLGGLSNLGATMHAPGVYEQRSDGHLLVGELQGGTSERCERVRAFLGRGLTTRTSANLRGAVWSKLLLNCAVTTVGAIAGGTFRSALKHPLTRGVFDGVYAEALGVAAVSGARPETMIVEAVPPADRDGWFARVLDAYGDVKPSMLQDFERHRRTEIDFINGYIVQRGEAAGIETPLNAAIVETVHAIERGAAQPSLDHIGAVLNENGARST